MAETEEILGQFLGDPSFPTDTGGTTSHPAVLAREFGIPAVIGTSVATHRIVTGDRLRIDGTSGRVEILRGEATKSRRDA